MPQSICAILRSAVIGLVRKQGGGGSATVEERKLNYRFHDPNPAAVTADYILKIFIEANAGKVEAAIQRAAEATPDADEEPGRCQGHSA